MIRCKLIYYAEEVLKRLSMQNGKLVSTPLINHIKLFASLCHTTDEEVEKMSQVPYANAVGSLMYAMICSKPDLYM